VSFTFSVVPNAPGSGTPTGSVTVSDGTQNCSASVALGSCSIAFSSVGGRSVTASYAGDGNFAASTSTGVSQTVNAASTTTTITDHTPNPSVAGQGIAVTFSVTSTAGTPTGNVSVSDGVVTCVASVAAGGCTLTPSTAGAKTLIATYAGDGDFAGSTSPGVGHTVSAAGTTTTITTHSPDPSAVGQAVTFTYTVVTNAPGSGTPTGSVTVSDGTQSCTASVAAGSCSIAFSSTGGRTVTASYAGDGNFAVSASTGVSQTVNTTSTTTSIISDTPDPSVAGVGFPVTFSVTSTGGTPTGTVTVSDGTQSCTASVAAGSCTLTPTAAGAHTLTATYTGDASFTGSTSADEAHTVNPAGADHLTFTGQPSDLVLGNLITPPVVVRVWDAFGNLATGFGGNVKIAIGTDPSLFGAKLGGTSPIMAISGVATFDDLTIDQIGVGFTLVATSDGLTPATSDPFTVIALP